MYFMNFLYTTFTDDGNVIKHCSAMHLIEYKSLEWKTNKTKRWKALIEQYPLEITLTKTGHAGKITLIA